MRRKYSLKTKKDFLRLYRRGKTSVDSKLVVYVKKGEANNCRIGFSISKKIGNAVVRNRIKRQLREIFRSRKSELNNIYDLVVVVRKGSVGATYQQLDKTFFYHCKKLGLIDNVKGDD